MAQLNYKQHMDPIVIGQKADVGYGYVETGCAEGDINFGYAVVAGTDKTRQVKIPTLVTDVFRGVAVTTVGVEQNDLGDGLYRDKSAVSVMRQGKIIVKVNGDVEPDDYAHFVYTGADAGLFRADTTNAVIVPTGVFRTAATAGNLAVLEINLPGRSYDDHLITNADISPNAHIQFSKLEALDANTILVGNDQNIATQMPIVGDVWSQLDEGALKMVLQPVVDGSKLAPTTADNIVAAVEAVHKFIIDGPSTGNHDIEIAQTFRVSHVVVNLRGAGDTDQTVEIKNNADNITDAISIDGPIFTVARNSLLDTTANLIGAGGILRATVTGETAPGLEIYVYGTIEETPE